MNKQITLILIFLLFRQFVNAGKIEKKLVLVESPIVRDLHLIAPTLVRHRLNSKSYIKNQVEHLFPFN